MHLQHVRWVCALALLLSACTKPNPRSCADGICDDPAFPFCDVDGTLEGTPMACVSVDCAPGELVACRGDEALRCNATGNDLDVVQCQLGCDPGANGCVSCTSDAQCANPTPICDTSAGICQACIADDDCASRVCDVDTGACLAESEVVYASPTGGVDAACTQADPCNLSRAAALASANPLRETVRMLPGRYSEELEITSGSVVLVGTGAEFQPASFSDGIRSLHSANVTIRGLTMSFVGELRCDGKSGDMTSTDVAELHLRDLELRFDFTGTSLFVQCKASMDRVTAVLDNHFLGILSDTTFAADRVRFTNPNPQGAGGVVPEGANLDISILNCVFEESTFGFFPDDAAPASRLVFAFNTILAGGTGQEALGCDGEATALLENNIVVRSNDNDAADLKGTCVATNNIFFPQSTPIPNNLIVDPQFVDLSTYDLHLRDTSPAVDAAMPSSGLDPDDDFEGTARPQGDAKDIGALERH